MVRTALCSLAAALGLTFPLATNSATAGPPAPYSSYRPGYAVPSYPAPGYPVVRPRPDVPVFRPPLHDCWEVRYRTCDHEPWRCHGHYHSASHAYQVARDLRRSGYETRVVFDR
jgi:hypothetical protein